MGRNRRFWLSLLLVIAVGVLLSRLVSPGIELASLTLRPIYILPLLGFYSAYLLATSLAWRVALHGTCGVRVSLFEALAQVAALNLGKYVPGKVWGMFARGLALGSRCSGAEVAAATVQEQVALLHAGSVVAAAAAGLVISPAFWFLAAALTLLVVLAPKWLGFALCLGERLVRRPGGLSSRLASPRSYACVFLFHVLVWVFLGLSLAALEWAALGVAPDPVRSSLLVLANVVGVTIGFFAVFAPGGIGVREAVTTALLLPVMPLEHAIMLTLLFRFWLMAAELLAGLLLLRPTLVQS